MKVCIGSAGRFHTFDLARQMERLGHLGRVYTAYPRWKVDGLPSEKVRTFPWLMTASVALARMTGIHTPQEIDWMIHDTFDRWMARQLRACDVFHCLSSFGRRTHRVAREQLGAVTVCDRGSSHIAYQDEILAEEHRFWGIPYRPIDRRIVDWELEEYEACDLITVPSTFAYRSFIEKGLPEAKLRKVPYGVDLCTFRPTPKKDRIFRIIYVGALSLRKGVLYLLQAMQGLRLPQFEVWLIGAALREVRPLLAKYDGLFRYFGPLPRTELYRYYSQASVFVLPSIEEGLALVQAQAMACGLPVIATTNTGVEDLFNDGVEGFIVPIRDPEAIRQKVLHLYQHRDVRDDMAQAALTRVQTLRGWNNYGEQMLRAYEDAIFASATSGALEQNAATLSN